MSGSLISGSFSGLILYQLCGGVDPCGLLEAPASISTEFLHLEFKTIVVKLQTNTFVSLHGCETQFSRLPSWKSVVVGFELELCDCFADF